MAEDFWASQPISVALIHQISGLTEPLGRDSGAAQTVDEIVREGDFRVRFKRLRKLPCL